MDLSSIGLYIVTVYLAGVLLASGLVKVVDRHDFTRTLLKQELVPKPAIPIVSHTIPVVEVAIALGLAFGIAGPLVGGITLALFAAFLVATAVLLAQGKDADCGCFGVVFKERIDAATIVRDLGFVAAAVAHVALALSTNSHPQALYLATGFLVIVLIVWVIAAPLLANAWWARTRVQPRRHEHTTTREEERDVTPSLSPDDRHGHSDRETARG